MKKLFLTKTRWLVTIMMLTILSVGNAWAEYAEICTITSGDVVTNSGYGLSPWTHTDAGSRSWVITYGGNNASVGTNSTNRSNCNLTVSSSAYAKYAVSPVTTSDVASAFANTTSLSNVSKISYSHSGGSNDGSTAVYLLYSSDNTTFSQIALTSGTQGATISNTYFEFAKCSGYFALLFKATNGSGNWRIDNVSITFYRERVMRTVEWRVENVEYTTGGPSTSVEVGSKVTTLPTNPSVPAGCLSTNPGAKFMGWTATANYQGAGAPADLFTNAAGAPDAPAGSGTIYYYAVFADPVAVDP